jgi:hypothetical protein
MQFQRSLERLADRAFRKAFLKLRTNRKHRDVRMIDARGSDSFAPAYNGRGERVAFVTGRMILCPQHLALTAG